MDTVQVFTASPRSFMQTLTNALAPPAIDLWSSHRRRLKHKLTASHDSYLINLASPDETLWRKSIDLFIEELRRCAALGIPYLVTHPGAHMGAGEEAGLARIVAALDLIHQAVPAKVLTCLEVTAGQGTSLGYRLEHLADIIDRVRAPRRLAVCLDTAHLFAAGYDFRGRRYPAFRKRLDALLGLDRIRVWHLNDSRKHLGSRVDRHDHIGHGKIGLTGFRPLLRDDAFANTPKILETPKAVDKTTGRDWDAINLETLRKLM